MCKLCQDMKENKELHERFKSNFNLNRNYNPIICCLLYLLDIDNDDFYHIMLSLGYNIYSGNYCWIEHIPVLDMLFSYSNDITNVSCKLFEMYFKYYCRIKTIAYILSIDDIVETIWHKYETKRPIKNSIHYKLFKASYNGDINTLKELLDKNKKKKIN